MKNNRNSQILAIVALLVAIFGVSVGFAAFSRSLTISSSAGVNPNSDTFQVRFSSSNTSYSTTAVKPSLSTTATGFTATDATISESDLTIKNLSATFTEPGQSVTYKFYVQNPGKYIAYLNSITFANATGGSSSKVCTATGNADATKVTAACSGITYSVKTSTGTYTATNADITDSTGIAINGFGEITVTIAYASNATRADGDFKVAFGNVSLVYGSTK